MKSLLWTVLAGLSALAVLHAPRTLSAAAQISDGVSLTTLSADASLVSGGDVLIRLTVPPDTRAGDVYVTLNSRDVTGAFTADTQAGTFVGLVTGLHEGVNALAARVGHLSSSLAVTNYPSTGPIISGPWQQPFICQTETFTLPDGTKLGPALDANCSARTVVQYVYRPTTIEKASQPFKPLPNPAIAPADVAQTTTVTGQTVNFIVRVETGTMNRGIYQNAILHDPSAEPAPSPLHPPTGWNHRLIAMHGSGCPGGWYIQGAAQGANILDPVRLGEGYALFINTLNHPTNSCNAFLAGESTMMGKEHFIETFGVPSYTISTGRSGGAYTSLQIADAFPGLFDGVEIGATFPDALSIALSGLDAHLLAHYFEGVSADALSEAQVIAVSGYAGMRAFIDAANQAQRTDPVPNRRDIKGYQSARWNAAVPQPLRYDPVKNPKGLRPTVFDAAKNVYGVDPATGAALRPYDNTGVQYGLNALNRGAITVQQFLALNQGVGGFDQDANYVPARTVGDAGAIRRAYQSGLHLGANGGLKSIPVFDDATWNDMAGYHYGWFHYAVRERLRKATGGGSDNMVMWRRSSGRSGRELFDRWMTAYTSDHSDAPQIERVLKAKPEEARDGCHDGPAPPLFGRPEELTFTSQPTSRCSELYPVYSNPRHEAGGPLAADILKCELKAVDLTDYRVSFSAEEKAHLTRIFPEGVCDWTRPGVNQVPVVPWASFGPSPKNRLN